MDIPSQPSAAQSGTPQATAPTSSSEDDSVISSDFETFLTLLTTQLENQDPLNPLDSSEFAQQLATFSGVEQQVKTNDLLRDISAGLGASGLNQLAGWVGMEARVNAPAVFDGTPLTLAPEIDPASDAATLIVRDVGGREVAREAMPPTSDTLLWAGVGPDGEPLPLGTYTFEVESVNQGEVTSTKPVDHYARIVEARNGASGVELVVPGGASIAASDIVALREPDAT